MITNDSLKVSTRKDSPDWQPCSTEAPFLKKGEEPPQMLQIVLDNLLEHDELRQVVQERLWKGFPGRPAARRRTTAFPTNSRSSTATPSA